MYNDFVIVGPVEDEAGIRHLADAVAALATLARSRTPFVSRGDDSGTHKKELSLWRAAKLDPQTESRMWYREAGAGMGAALNIAAYTLTDRGTWLSFRNKQGFAVLVEGDPRLFNQQRCGLPSGYCLKTLSPSYPLFPCGKARGRGRWRALYGSREEEDPEKYHLQRTLGVAAMHTVLLNVLVIIVSNGSSVFDSVKYAEIMEKPRRALGVYNKR